MSKTVKQVRETLNKQLFTYRAELKKQKAKRDELFTAEGKPKYLQTYQDEVIGQVKEVCQKEYNDLLKVFGEAKDWANAEIERYSLFDPLENLTNSQLSEANQKAQFVKEDIDNANSERLLQLARIAINKNDRVVNFLTHRYIEQRASRETLQSGATVKVPEWYSKALPLLEQMKVNLTNKESLYAIEDAQTLLNDIETISLQAIKEKYMTTGDEEKALKSNQAYVIEIM